MSKTTAGGADLWPEELFTELVGDRAAEWDRTGRIPLDTLRGLGAKGLLCAQAPAAHGGLAFSSRRNGELTAHVGTLCSSLRSVMTSQGMAAWTLRRLAGPGQQAALVPRLTGGELAAVAFSEAGAGSDLSALRTRITRDGDEVVVDGAKVWTTNAAYADLLVVFGRTDDGAGAVVVPASAPGVRVERIDDPLGCRAAGHADIRLDGVRLPADALLQGVDRTPALLVTTALGYGRMSVAWGCTGILRGCLTAAARHAKAREQFGVRLAEHQLVARHLAELLVAEQSARRACEHASDLWDEGSPDMVTAAVLAKHVAATGAARGAARAVQVLASAGSRDGHTVARALRDAKLMEIIEGSSEICELMLSQHALATAG
ncbi:acyl-CoA dehydrogenase family protein [Streptomyces sp. HU2014]|uniref:acyl-CoA dehydrogenase family protein n=1 Tax=Streptomyces sp. HU2014 TaxID=2939414 RepID=UPI00200BC1B0|nr:acyl-CoA dehydrogenase family protein [Streptomyces sp. HU2014]UQI47376.1 acyl-CoA dehydrogenase family protein [Streptomyces sp. HU2014]